MGSRYDCRARYPPSVTRSWFVTKKTGDLKGELKVEQSSISIRQFTLLVIFFTIGTSILFVPTVLSAEAKQDAWIAAILGTGVGVAIVCLYAKLAMLFPNMTFVQYSETILGKWLGKFVSLTFLLYLLNFGVFLL